MALTNTHTPHSAINVLDEWGNNVRGSQRRPLKMITKSKCLDRNKPRERDFQEAPMQMDLGHVTASSGDGGKLQVPHVFRHVLQRIAVCCRVMQWLQRIAVCCVRNCGLLQVPHVVEHFHIQTCVAVCRRVLYSAVIRMPCAFSSVFAVYCSVL